MTEQSVNNEIYQVKDMEGNNLVFIRDSTSAFKCRKCENLRKMSDLLRRGLDIGPLLTQARTVSTGAKLYATVSGTRWHGLYGNKFVHKMAV